MKIGWRFWLVIALLVGYVAAAQLLTADQWHQSSADSGAKS